jgi:outer membrane protein assembly factor BamB
LLVVSGIRQGTHAYRIARTGATWTVTQAWKNADIAMYMSSPVVADDVIYGLSSRRKGQFVAVDAATGATRWATEGRAAEHASTLLAPQHVVFLTSAGTLIVAKRATASFDAERTIELAGAAETWAMPIVLGPDLIVREGGSIVRFGAQK